MLPRAVALDAQGFLDRLGPNDVFEGDISADVAADFLRGERSRLDTRVGAAALDERAQAVEAEDHRVNDNVVVRGYRPQGGDPVKPMILYIHGGGWVSGSIDQHDSTCRVLAVEADAVVVNVDYRLAPEHSYPAALDDCEAALIWVMESAGDSYKIDRSRLAVCGSSSGGNLAAALALRMADEHPDRIALQVLIYPALDAGMSGESYRLNRRGYFISANRMAWYWDCYRGDVAQENDPQFSPLSATDVASLPPAVIVTAEFDPLRDDGVRFADLLGESGVAVRRIHYPGQIHGFMGLLEDIREAYPAVSALGAVIGDTLRAGKASPVWQTHGQMV